MELRRCEMKDAAQNALRFPRLRKVALLILTIRHSNTEEERVFSIIRKNKTCFRPRLDPEETLASIVTVKLAMESENMDSFHILDEVLTAAKVQLTDISWNTRRMKNRQSNDKNRSVNTTLESLSKQCFCQHGRHTYII